MANVSKEQWEQRISEAGSGRYDFVRWVAVCEYGSHKKCVVRCKVGNFVWSARANELVNGGKGCPHCSGKIRWTAEERIWQINKMGNIRFISWTDGYKNASSKANVMCLVDNHSWSAEVGNIVNKGSGCPQCAGNRRLSAEERIKQINDIDNIEFVSWVDEYKCNKSKANVRCKVDGFVWSTAINGLLNIGSGCPRCAKTGFDQTKDGSLYALRSECGKYVKVGISNKPSQRHRQLERSTPFKFNLVEQISGDGAKIAELEKHFHEKYERAGFKGFDGATEWLICSDELLSELRSE